MHNVVRGRNHKRVRTQKLYIFLIGIFVMSAFTTWITNHEKVTINTILVDGTEKTIPIDIQAIVNKHLDKSYFFIVPKRNVVLMPIDEIKEDLLTTFTIIKDVSIKKINLQTIQVKVEERIPHAKWCGIDNNENRLETCLLLDNEAYLYTYEEKNITSALYTFFGPLITSTETASTSLATTPTNISTSTPVHSNTSYIGKTYIDSSTFHKINAFATALKSNDITSDSMTFENSTGYIHLNKGGYLIFNMNRNLGTVAEDVLLAYTQKFINDTKKPEQLDYIDSRFNNKVLFKFVE